MLSTKEFIYACSCLIFVSIEIVNACSCSQNSLNKTYCDADWIAKIRVDKIKLLTNLTSKQKEYYIYEVKILEQFKGPYKLNRTAYENFKTKPWIYTPPEPGICGIFLKRGQDYLVTGKSKDGKFIVLKECDQFSDDDYEEDPPLSTVESIFNTTLSNNNTTLHYEKSDDEEVMFRWDNVSKKLKNLLKSHSFEPCKNN